MNEIMKAKFSEKKKPPEDALKTIDFGNLKGKSDINPQWRIEALTDVYGLCGVGWYFEILSTNFQEVNQTGERMVYLTVAIHVKTDKEEWSAPVIGIGGDFIVIKDKNGIHGNDEAFQMALTDAIGKAAKCLGIASDIYRGRYDSKYGWRDEREKKEQELQKQKQEQQRLKQEQRKNLDTKENWRIIDENTVHIKGNDGKFYNLNRLTVGQLQKALSDERNEGIRKFIEAEIARKGG